ncbi:hypothetical protein S2M10_24090 [Sphingomonas sp. S2M10]|uniref:hypothetical protein n=1 Tax=Sphingomonas sp. S2M10 TaxID=2705010 RepID=UPI0014571915|nr:hypothetical protein [Sphingomonas sp. S2M10]NLS27413.1 hypothetical protein [Sphingomonas sp. S2M10]
MIQGALLLFWFALLVADGTPIGRTLRRVLVEAPARWCNRWSRGEVVLVLGFVAAAAAIVWVMETEGAVVFGMMAPEAIAWASMFEIGTLVDIAITTVTVFTALRVKGLRHWVAARFSRRLPRARRTRRTARPTANDDAEGPAFALAA